MVKQHYTVVVQVKRVTKEPDTVQRGAMAQTTVPGERVVEDIVNVVTQSPDARSALVKAMKLLDVELSDHNPDEGWDA